MSDALFGEICLDRPQVTTAFRNQMLVDWVSGGVYAMESAVYEQINPYTVGTIATATLIFPNGVRGQWVTDTASTDFPGVVDGFHVTYPLGVFTLVVTQPLVTRNASGQITECPALVLTQVQS